MVLLKGVDARGFCFYSHHDNDKGGQLAAHPQATWCFYWQKLGDGVRIRRARRGEKPDAASFDHYFVSRPRLSQLGA